MSSRADVWKISGKRLEVASDPADAWKFTARPGGWIIAESPSGERRRFALHEFRGKLSAAIGGHLWFGDVAAPARKGTGGAGGSAADLTSQFPGKVRKILVAEGAAVAEGEPLLLLEAMKMEFSVKAPSAGVVVKVLVSEGQQLSPGTLLVDFQETKGSPK